MYIDHYWLRVSHIHVYHWLKVSYHIHFYHWLRVSHIHVYHWLKVSHHIHVYHWLRVSHHIHVYHWLWVSHHIHVYHWLWVPFHIHVYLTPSNVYVCGPAGTLVTSFSSVPPSLVDVSLPL